jgi:hypothetical protein
MSGPLFPFIMHFVPEFIERNTLQFYSAFNDLPSGFRVSDIEAGQNTHSRQDDCGE